MTISIRTLVPAKTVEATQTTQYVAPVTATIIDKFTFTNFSAAAATISVNLVTLNDTPSNSNLIIKARTLQPSETYTCPELVGQVLGKGAYISTLAGTGSAINMRVSGREVT